MKLLRCIWFYFFSLFIFQVHAFGQGSSAHEVINACIEANGGVAYLDSLYQNIQLKSVETRYQTIDPMNRLWLLTPQGNIQYVYRRRGGEGRREAHHMATGEVTKTALNQHNYWKLQDGTLATLDSGLVFESLWELQDDGWCLEMPLNFLDTCRKYPLQYNRLASEHGEAYHVLSTDGPFAREYWFSQESHLLYKTVAGSNRHHYYEDYRQVGKLWFAHRSKTKNSAGRVVAEVAFLAVSFPESLPDSLFTLPKQYRGKTPNLIGQ